MSPADGDESVRASRRHDGETVGRREVRGMKKITIRKTGPIKLTSPALYGFLC
jgi:hypothetical protein